MTPNGNVIPGSAWRPAPRVYYSPVYTPVSSRSNSPLGAAIGWLVASVALTIIGILSIALGDIPFGIFFTAIGGLGIAGSIACIAFLTKNRLG